MLSFFPRDVLDEMLNLIESVSEGFPSYSFLFLALAAILFIGAIRFLAIFLVSHLGNIPEKFESHGPKGI